MCFTTACTSNYKYWYVQHYRHFAIPSCFVFILARSSRNVCGLIFTQPYRRARHSLIALMLTHAAGWKHCTSTDGPWHSAAYEFLEPSRTYHAPRGKQHAFCTTTCDTMQYHVGRSPTTVAARACVDHRIPSRGSPKAVRAATFRTRCGIYTLSLSLCEVCAVRVCPEAKGSERCEQNPTRCQDERGKQNTLGVRDHTQAGKKLETGQTYVHGDHIYWTS